MNALVIGLTLVIGAPGGKDAKKDAPSIVGEWNAEKLSAVGRKRRNRKAASPSRLPKTAR